MVTLHDPPSWAGLFELEAECAKNTNEISLMKTVLGPDNTR